MRIVYLCDYPEYIDTVVDWIYQEFIIKESKNKDKSIIREYFSNTYYDSFPITYVAVEGKECLGTVSIFDNDLKPREDLCPWLASLYVSEKHRAQGIAAKLINKVLSKAVDVGYSEVYLRTEHTAGYYRTRNWQFVSSEVDIDGRETEVYRYDLKYKVFQMELKHMLLEFIKEMKEEEWFGKEREIINRFVFSKLVKNIDCCDIFTDPAQIGIEVRVKQIRSGKKEVCKDLVIWKKNNQTVWSDDNVPICIIEWKHRNKQPAKYDIDWLKTYTEKNKESFGIALNVENEKEYTLTGVLIESGQIVDEEWVDFIQKELDQN